MDTSADEVKRALEFNIRVRPDKYRERRIRNQEMEMRKSMIAIGSAFLLVAGVAAAGAAEAAASDSGPVVQDAQAMQAADQSGSHKASIRQQIEGQLTKDGYKNVTIMPSSFFVRANDKQGNPVEMVIGPDSLTEVTEVKPTTAPSAPQANNAAPKAAAAQAPSPKN